MDELDIMAQDNKKLFNPNFLEGITTAVMPIEVYIDTYSANHFDRASVEPVYSVYFKYNGVFFYQKKPMRHKTTLIYDLSYDKIRKVNFYIGEQKNTAMSFQTSEHINTVMVKIDLLDKKQFRFWNYDLNIILPIIAKMKKNNVQVDNSIYDYVRKNNIVLTDPLIG